MIAGRVMAPPEWSLAMVSSGAVPDGDGPGVLGEADADVDVDAGAGVDGVTDVREVSGPGDVPPLEEQPASTSAAAAVNATVGGRSRRRTGIGSSLCDPVSGVPEPVGCCCR
jgi:hypothetical protein